MKFTASVTLTLGILAVCATVIIISAQCDKGTGVLIETEQPTTKISYASKQPTVFAPAFQPPREQDMPTNEFGQMVRLGENIFEHTDHYAPQYVGPVNFSCSGCHLNAGRLADSAPLWAAYVSYPAYRGKTEKVSTFAARLQGCFQYSMNGKAPPLGDPVLVALESYAFWLASGASIDAHIRGRGYPHVPKPPLPPDYSRGQQVFEQHCSVCHGADGAGQMSADGRHGFPALWGPKSFNWGAGMASIKNASGFIKANMPLALGGTLGDQQAWDVAIFMNSHERPQDVSDR